MPGNSPYCDVHTVLCVGADSTPADLLVEEAQGNLAKESDPEAKQRYEKVHKDTHTCTIVHFCVTNDCWKRSCPFSVFACQY